MCPRYKLQFYYSIHEELTQFYLLFPTFPSLNKYSSRVKISSLPLNRSIKANFSCSEINIILFVAPYLTFLTGTKYLCGVWACVEVGVVLSPLFHSACNFLCTRFLCSQPAEGLIAALAVDQRMTCVIRCFTWNNPGRLWAHTFRNYMTEA